MDGIAPAKSVRQTEAGAKVPHGDEFTMKAISLTKHAAFAADSRKLSRGLLRSFPVGLLAFGISALATACGDDTSCVETATCAPNPTDGGSDDTQRDRDGSVDRIISGDGSEKSDVRTDTDTDRSSTGTADAKTTDEARVDSLNDSPPRDSSEAGREDVSTDARILDVTSIDASTENSVDTQTIDGNTDSGSTTIDAQRSDTSDDDARDAGSTVDVATGCNPSTCPTGCCNVNNQCVTAPGHEACGGWGGGMCKGCGVGQACDGTSCVCTPSSCTTGCCNGAICVPFADQSDGQCGAGAVCGSCTATMQKCDTSNGQCVCNAASCPTGCCDNAKHCVPYGGQSDMVCGMGGLACSSCASDKYCNGGGGCDAKNWCRTQTIPASVAPEDYQCVDFDSGMPPSNVWPPVNQGQGILALQVDQVRSVPYSLSAFVSENQPLNIAKIAWNASGGFVSSVTVVTDFYPIEPHGFGEGYVDNLCLTIGGLKGCLSYALAGLSSADRFALTIPMGAPGPGIGFPVCEVTPPFTFREWARIQLTLTKSGTLSLSVNGSTTTCTASDVMVGSGTTRVQVGAESVGLGHFGDVRFDNLVAYIKR